MATIHIHRQLNSDTLPELRPLIGKTVDIIVRESGRPTITSGTGDWSAWPTAASDLEGYDFEAWKTQRECDLRHTDDHLL